MVKETIELTKLTASDGMILTNGDAFAREAYIGNGDSSENWHEITVSEYEKIMEDKERIEMEKMGE